MRNSTVALSLSAVAFLNKAVRSQTTWYVDVNGAPPGSGTQADPYTSIGYAVSRPTTLTGDTVLVAPGTYLGAVSPSRAVTIQSTGGPGVTRIHGNYSTSASFPMGKLSGFTLEGHAYPQPGWLDQCAVIAPSGDSYNGIFFDYDTKITRCTVSGFTIGAMEFGFNNDHVLIENTVLLSNDSDLDLSGWNELGQVRYCRFHSSNIAFTGYDTVGNIGADPALWDPIHGYVRLKPGSPCIDSGDPAAPLDPDGSRVDMGAFAYDATYAPEPTPYCMAKPNSLGCLPGIGHQGDCSVTNPTPFLVRAIDILPNKTGFLFYGTGEASAPLQGGTRCVRAPFKRTPASNSGSGGSGPCAGILSFDFNARIRSGVDPALVPGRMVYAQFYYRDPADPSGFGTGLSDGLRFGIAP